MGGEKTGGCYREEERGRIEKKEGKSELRPFFSCSRNDDRSPKLGEKEEEGSPEAIGDRDEDRRVLNMAERWKRGGGKRKGRREGRRCERRQKASSRSLDQVIRRRGSFRRLGERKNVHD